MCAGACVRLRGEQEQSGAAMAERYGRAHGTDWCRTAKGHGDRGGDQTAQGQQVAGSGQRGSGVILPKGLAVPYGAAIRAPGR